MGVTVEIKNKTGWSIAKKRTPNSNKATLECAYSKDGIVTGLSGYIYIYYNKKQCLEECEQLNEIWGGDLFFPTKVGVHII